MNPRYEARHYEFVAAKLRCLGLEDAAREYDAMARILDPDTCPTCGGSGIDRRFGMERGCQDCRGTGRKEGA